MRKKKGTNSKEPAERPYRVVDQVRDGYSMRMRPISEAFIEDLALKLIADAKNDPDVLSIESFCNKHDITRSTLDNWAKKFPFFGEAKEKAMTAFGSRLENGALKGKEGIRERTAREILPVYSKTWKDREDSLAALAKDSQGSGSFVAVLEAFPSSDKVPERAERIEE